MPLTDFVAPDITENYLRGLTKDQLVDLLRHKTNGLLAATRLFMNDTPDGKKIQHDVKLIQQEIGKRQENSESAKN